MWTHSASRCCSRRCRRRTCSNRRSLLSAACIEAMLDRRDKAVEDFIVEPGSERMGPLRVSMRELVEFVW